MTSIKARPSTPEELSALGEIQDAGEKMMSAYASLVASADGKYAPKLVVKIPKADLEKAEYHGDHAVVDISNALLHPVIVLK